MDIEQTARRYYHDIDGLAHDFLLRCKDCRRLVLYSDLKKRGSCKCGNRRVVEITTLNLREWLKIRLGILDFPYRREFLREFPGLWSALRGGRS